jgi:hypothetical protein
MTSIETSVRFTEIRHVVLRLSGPGRGLLRMNRNDRVPDAVI